MERMWDAARATQASTAGLASDGDSARTRRRVRSRRAFSLRRAPASRARTGTGTSGANGILCPFRSNRAGEKTGPPCLAELLILRRLAHKFGRLPRADSGIGNTAVWR